MRDQAGPVRRPHPRQLPEEDPSPAGWHGQASGKRGGGSAPQARPEHAGTRNSTRGTRQLREHWRSPLNWAGRLFGNPPHLWGKTLGLVLHSPTPRHFSRVSKQKQKRGRKTKKRKSTHLLGKGVLHTPEGCGGSAICPSVRHCTRSVKFSGKTPRHFSSSLCWFQSLSFTPMSQPSSCSSGFWKGITSTTSPALS